MEVVHTVLLAELLEGAPVLVGHTEPLAVPGPDVDVDGREVVVLLMAGSPGSGNLNTSSQSSHQYSEGRADLEIELDGVHAEYLVADVREHVTSADHSQPAGQLEQLLDLGPPLLLVRQITIGSELDGAAGRLPALGVHLHLNLKHKES